MNQDDSVQKPTPASVDGNVATTSTNNINGKSVVDFTKVCQASLRRIEDKTKTQFFIVFQLGRLWFNHRSDKMYERNAIGYITKSVLSISGL